MRMMLVVYCPSLSRIYFTIASCSQLPLIVLILRKHVVVEHWWKLIKEDPINVFLSACVKDSMHRIYLWYEARISDILLHYRIYNIRCKSYLFSFQGSARGSLCPTVRRTTIEFQSLETNGSYFSFHPFQTCQSFTSNTLSSTTLETWSFLVRKLYL